LVLAHSVLAHSAPTSERLALMFKFPSKSGTPATSHSLSSGWHLTAILTATLALVALSAACPQSTRAQTAAPTQAQSPAQVPAASASPRGDAKPERRVVLRFITEGEFPPFNYYDDEGVLTGFNVDLARAICLEVNAACDVQAKPWDDLIPSLKRGEADGVIAAHVVSAPALKQVDFTDRYFHFPARFIGKRGGAKIEITPDGIDGKKVAVTKDTAHLAYLSTFFRLAQIQVFETPDLAREALLTGKVDLMFDDAVSLAFWINGTVSKECCEFKGGPFLEPRYFGEGIAIAVPKTDPELKFLLNGALRRVRASGRFDELVQQYFRMRIY
jgi:polar amino acid transport system substrate-binding protein